MRWNGFGRALVFGAVAAAALLVFEPLAAPWLGTRGALRAFLVATAAVYLLGLGPSWRRGFVAASVASASGSVLLLLPLGLTTTALGAAALVAIGRSGVLYQSRPLRAVGFEAVLQGAGLAVAAFLSGHGIVSLALAIWGYLLIQSAFFLLAGVQLRREAPAGDAFDRARDELLALLR